MNQPPAFHPFHYMQPWQYYQYPISHPIPTTFGQYHSQPFTPNSNITPPLQSEPIQSSTPTENVITHTNNKETLSPIAIDNIEVTSEEDDEESEVEIEINNTMANGNIYNNIIF